MSVLYKALQKAEKENEARLSASSETNFDPQRLAASGALRFAGGKSVAVNRIIMAALVIIGVGGGSAFLLFKDELMGSAAPLQTARPAVVQPAPAQSAATAPVESTAAAAPTDAAPTETPAATAAEPVPLVAEAPVASPAQTEIAAANPPPTAAAPSADAATATEASPPPVAPPAEKQVAAAPQAAVRATPRRPEAMPQIPVDSSARMLNPPISINRAEFALAGVGNQVQVREVSRTARSNVAAGYDALIRGSYDTALGFYEGALKEEPSSVLALLGRATSLQKMGRGADAQGSYEQVLKLDPNNREALTNLTTIVAERSPQEAITRLLELEREYATFSPIKAQIGLTYAKMGSMPQAADYLRRALQLSPETAMYHYNLALVLDHLGRRDQAIMSYERVLASLSTGRGPAELSAPEIERRVRFLRAK